MGDVGDMGPCNYCASIRCEHIAQSLSIKRRFKLRYILYISFAALGPLVGCGLLRKVALEIAGFGIVKPREKNSPFLPNPSFAQRFRRSN